MDGSPQPTQHNQPLPPLPSESSHQSISYQRPAISSALPHPAQDVDAFSSLQSFPQQQQYLPDTRPRNVGPLTVPLPPLPPPYSQSSYTPIYGQQSTLHPEAQLSGLHMQFGGQEQPLPLPGQAVNVPEWQPDNDVRNCPICNATFTFFVRRHHCRKCGRVVCAPCSSQKIFLPSSAVVRNPAEVPLRTPPSQGLETSPLGLLGYNARGDSYLSRNATGMDPNSNRHSWAGGYLPDILGVSNELEEVRACEDCKLAVNRQDEESMGSANLAGAYRTWTGLSTTAPGRPEISSGFWQSSAVNMDTSTGSSDGNGRRRRQSLQGGRSLPYTYDPGNPPRQIFGNTSHHTHLSQWATTSQGAQSQSYSSGQYNFPTNVNLSNSQSFGDSRSQGPSNTRYYAPSPSSQQRSSDDYHQNLRRLEHSSRPYVRHQHRTSERIVQSQPQPVPLPHNLKETDYCPICTRRLPPPHPDTGDETEREKHIQSCIAEQTAVSPRKGQGSRDSAYLGGSNGGYGSPNNAGRSNGAIDRAEAGRRMGPNRGGARMVTYVATENDTWDFNTESDEENKVESQEQHGLGNQTVFEAGNEDVEHQGTTVGDDVIITYSNIPENPLTKSKMEQKSREKKKVRKKAECVICFEDFETGQLISRLDCLCRYHKDCIEDWFKRRNGNRECPVHAVRD